MKIEEKTSTSELVDRFDNELRELLMNDLKAIRATKDSLVNKINKGLNQDSLTAA
ncbi:MAG: hypothetical protein ABIN91_23175 [Mucilaginibacter sp.]|uniref:hypothetical protein n=1 Tax=Mucilaginibacter sp. TaxID=1882438 RepID=UPI003262E053